MTRRVWFFLLGVACLSSTAVSAQDGILPVNSAPSSVGSSPIAVQPLSGVLFFSRDQRERLDRARTRGAPLSDSVAAEPAPSVLDGFVKRSDGQSAIWVDGQPRYNVQSDGVRRLQPQDVGGANEHLKVLSSSTQSPAIKTPGGKPKLPRQRQSVPKSSKRK